MLLHLNIQFLGSKVFELITREVLLDFIDFKKIYTRKKYKQRKEKYLSIDFLEFLAAHNSIP